MRSTAIDPPPASRVALALQNLAVNGALFDVNGSSTATVLGRFSSLLPVGITGANFLVAETGGVVIVTNEGNADLTASLPDTHIVVTGIEKVVPTLDDTGLLLRLLAFHKSTAKLGYVAVRTARVLAVNGFCMPSDEKEGEGGERSIIMDEHGLSMWLSGAIMQRPGECHP